ncbi:unnamed protein product [Owenia fusiformis]|uniref:Uncharacterized protein n=1 Tax=Owenia fusiformis TaxID=6347 RepID=A0A8J1TRH5_OWEFU|nr:unnamed protein product [Owenia fusiformis]
MISNETCPEIREISPVALVIHSTVAASIAFAAAVSNGIMLIILCKNFRKLSSTSILVFSLTIADFITGLICIPLMIFIRLLVPLYAQKGEQLLDPGAQSMVCCATFFSGLVTYIVSFCIMAAVAVERFLGMLFYRTLHQRVAKRNAKLVAVALWIYITTWVAGALPQNFNFNPELGCHLSLSFKPLFVLVVQSHYGLCLALCVIFYIFIFVTIKKHRNRINVQIQTNPVIAIAHLNQQKWTVTIFLVVAVFIATWFPFFITVNIIKEVNCILPWKKNVLFSVTELAYLSSLANPWIYTYRHRCYRNALIKLLQPNKIQPL